MSTFYVPNQKIVVGRSTTVGVEKEFIDKIVLPKNLIGIQEFTFNSFQNVKTIVFPDSLEWINEYAFKDCFSLERIKLNKNLKHINSGVFENCYNLKEIYIYNNNTKIDIRIDAFDGTSEELKIYVQNANNLNHEFLNQYYNKIINFTSELDVLIEKGKSLKEINEIFKNKDIER